MEVRFYPPSDKEHRQPVGGNKIQPFNKSGNTVHYVGGYSDNFAVKDRPECDGIWSDNPKQLLETYSADCANVVFTNKERFGVLHLGWRQLLEEDNVITQMLTYFKGDVYAALGPCIHSLAVKPNSETEKLLKQKFNDYFFEENERLGLSFLFREAVLHTLIQHGIMNIITDRRDTLSNYPAIDSYRGRKQAGVQELSANYLCIGRSDVYKDEVGSIIGELPSDLDKPLLPSHTNKTTLSPR